VRHALIHQEQRDAVVAQLSAFSRPSAPSGESLLTTRYSAPYCERKSRSIARKTSGSSSTVSKIGFAMFSRISL